MIIHCSTSARTSALFLGALISAGALAQDAPALAAPASEAGTPSLHLWLLGLAMLQTVLIIALGSILRTLAGPGPQWAKLFGNNGTRALVLLPLLLAMGHAQAQAYVAPATGISEQAMSWLLVALNLLLAFVIAFQLRMLRHLTRLFTAPAAAMEPALAPAPRPSWWARTVQGLTRQVPVEEEKTIELDHEYDGIRELDNSLPPWWLWLFYGTIAWSVFYLVNVHVIKVWPDQDTEYRLEMAQAKAEVDAYLATLTDLVDENTVERRNDAGQIASGKTLYMDNCTPCHGKALEGVEGLGPNLVDPYWKHGGGIKNVFRVIKYGVPDKGMISWKSQLKPSEIAALSEYILSLEGSDPPNAKAPEGDLWQDDGAASPVPAGTDAGTDSLRTALHP